MTNLVRVTGYGVGNYKGAIDFRTALCNLTIFDKYEAAEGQLKLKEGQILVTLNQGDLSMLIITSYEQSPDLKLEGTTSTWQASVIKEAHFH